MGYSLSVPCRSPQARDQLVDFLREHHRPFHRVLREHGVEKVGRIPVAGEEDYDPTVEVRVGNQLAYGRGPSKVGFNFGGAGMYGTWMYAVLGWAALRVGRRRGLNAMAADFGLGESFPYLTYDKEPHPIILDGSPEISGLSDEDRGELIRRGLLVDSLGLSIPRTIEERARWFDMKTIEEWLSKEQEADETKRRVARAELTRLEGLWVARFPPLGS